MGQKKIIKALYSNIAMLKGFCPNCKGYYFVRDGKLACCGENIEIPKNEIIKRMSETTNQRYFSCKDKKAVMEQQKGCCVYCGIDLTGYYWDVKKSKYVKVIPHYDHFRAWMYNQNSEKTNLIVSCGVCNLLKTSRYFATLQEARDYVLLRRKDKGID
ncbi:MAG: HNH endonuclease signature motif containing protein [Planctomycetota bacterium]|nr:HNH endonuclease signature motif containing protein [Planctomycetota bacterium]